MSSSGDDHGPCRAEDEQDGRGRKLVLVRSCVLGDMSRKSARPGAVYDEGRIFGICVRFSICHAVLQRAIGGRLQR